MPDTTPPIHFITPALLKFGETACKQSTRTHPFSENPGQVTCFTCRKSAPFLVRHDREPALIGEVLAEHPLTRGVGTPTPTMVRIEPDTSGHVMFTTAQFLQAAALIRTGPHLHHDLVEERFKQDSITHARLMLWRWPSQYTEQARPVRYWIEPDGSVSLVERCDWITAEEWPAWAKTGAEQ